eukprot:7364185-Alexandrium_andersonii.AAC.1
MAPRLDSGQSAAVALHPAVHVDATAHTATVAVERLSGEGLGAVHALTPSAMSHGELRTVRLWQCRPKLIYAFGETAVAPAELHEPMQSMVAGLLSAATHAVQGRSFTISMGAATSGQQKSLDFMLAHGLVEQLQRDDHSSSWSLTGLGRNSLRMLRSLHSPRNILETHRPGVAFADMSLFELLLALDSSGW